MKDLIEDWKNRKAKTKTTHTKFVQKLKREKAKKLNELGDELHEEVFQKIDCLDCANCCSTIPPMLNRTDINRIAKNLGMKASQFQEQYLRMDEDGDMVMKTSPCPFLEKDNACQIYDFRPRACREYPHTDQFEFAEHLKLHPINSRHCPAVFHILEKMMLHLS